MRTLIKQILHEDEAAAAVLFAAALPPLIGVAALAVDLGSLYLAERQLQGLADAAASIGQADGSAQSAVDQMISDSGMDQVTVHTLTEGEYMREREIDWQSRFDATSPTPNAARVVLTQQVPLYFGSLLTGSSVSTVSASAIATRLDMAGFMLGSRVLAVNGALANQVLSALAGTDLGLSQAQINLLLDTRVDVLDVTEALGSLNGLEDATFGEVLSADTQLNLAVEAMAEAAGDGAASQLLAQIAAEVNGDFFSPDDLIDLGPLANTDVNDGSAGVAVDSYSLLRAFIQASHGDSYEVQLGTTVAGLANVDLRLAGGFSDERSPWLTVHTADQVTLRTAETRLLVKVRTNPILGLPAALNVPVYTQLASAEAQMTDIVCGATDGSSGVYVSATPSIGQLAIADVNVANFDDFSVPLWLEPAHVLKTGLVDVTAFADVDVGGGAPSTLHFTPTEVKQLVTKSAPTTDPVGGVASSLVSDVDIDVKALGLGLNLGGTSQLVGGALGTIAPAIDGLFVQLTQVLGIGLGNADVTVDRLRCGRATIVG